LPQNFVLPVNRIFAGGSDCELYEYIVGDNADEDDMVPGRFVAFDYSDGEEQHVMETAAGDTRVMGIIEVRPDYKLDDIHEIGDWMLVIPIASGARVVAHLAYGQHVYEGDKVIPANNGEVTVLVPAAMGSQGLVVGKVLKECNATSAACNVLLELICTSHDEAAGGI